MFRDIKTGVDILQKALDLRSEIIRRKRKRRLLLDLLTFYFCLYRVVETGRELLSIAGEEPLRKVMSLLPEQRLTFLLKYTLYS